MARSKSSNDWMKEHFDDHYVKMAQKAGYRSRSTFKLEEIDKKDKLIRPSMVVVDLGSAPGGWSDYALRKMGDKGTIVALDILPMTALTGVHFIEGDFREDHVLDELNEVINGQQIDLVLSDMAPNITGVSSIDQPASMYLVELALDFAVNNLSKQGCFLVKVFQGAGFEQYMKAMRESFQKVTTRKPDASRLRSREVYLLGRGLK